MDIIERIKNDISLLKDYIKNSNEKLGKYKKDLTYINNETNKMIDIINIDYSKEYLMKLADDLGNYELFCAFKDYILKYNVTIEVYVDIKDSINYHVIKCSHFNIFCTVSEEDIYMDGNYTYINTDINTDNLTFKDLYNCDVSDWNKLSEYSDEFTKPEHLKDIKEIIKCCIVNIIKVSYNDIIYTLCI
uniref:Uncharacterized protein n=1 Tax=Pithovirus LCPAC102 TaxID=2506587 RepID=A0A481Z315_9VIRU|nr:MAG: hypothetical protein LCPAC102_01200 [Pithovirus LCPAC102]